MGLTKIVKSHGQILGSKFILPKNVSFITLVDAGDVCPFNINLDTEIYNFYKRGNKLFEKNDKTTTFTPDGLRFKNFLIDRGFTNVNIRNHIGDGSTPFNDLLLTFEEGCPTLESCSILCISPEKSGSCKVKYKNKSVDNIYLSQLIEKEGYDTYIVIACRSYSSNISQTGIRLVRELSGQPPNQSTGKTNNNNID